MKTNRRAFIKTAAVAVSAATAPATLLAAAGAAEAANGSGAGDMPKAMTFVTTSAATP